MVPGVVTTQTTMPARMAPDDIPVLTDVVELAEGGRLTPAGSGGTGSVGLQTCLPPAATWSSG
jgi:hypothetical protein